MNDSVVTDSSLSVGPASLTRLEQAAVLGGVLAVVGMALPWLSGPGTTVTGFTYGPISPVLASASLLAGLAALPDAYPVPRHALIALDGMTLTVWGTILVLGIPSALTGAGLYVTTVGGLVVTGAGYTGLVRRLGTYRATALVCGGSLVIVVGMMVALAG